MRKITKIKDALAWFEEDSKFESKYRKHVNCNLPDGFKLGDEPNVYYTGFSHDFEHDSCPEAWMHYKRHYTVNTFSKTEDDEEDKNTDRYSLSFLRYRYCTTFYTLHAVQEGNVDKGACNRLKESCNLRGDCDFNFNEKKYPRFLEKLFNGDVTKEEIELLIKCHDMHHTLLNFSLMQGVGGMQQFKGSGYDRLNRLVYHLNRYYETTLEVDRENTPIVSRATEANRPALIDYLNQFNNINDYCAKIYFLPTKEYYTGMMEDEKVFNKIAPLLVEKGSDWQTLLESNAALIKDLVTSEDKLFNVVDYMLLAVRFWQAKEEYFKLMDKVLEEAKNQ